MNETNNQEINVLKEPSASSISSASAMEVKQTDNIPSNNVPKQPKGSKLKTFGVIMIFVILFGVVVFLPEISKFMESRKEKQEEIIPPSNQEKTQILSCKLEKKTDTTNIVVRLSLTHENSNLRKSIITNEVTMLKEGADDTKVLRDMHLKCQEFKNVIEKQKGIKQTCTLKDNTQTIEQDIDYKKLDDIAIKTNIGELEGFFPEFTYNQDIKYIEAALTDSGYSCNIK